jgi:hypothetical protein
MDWTTETPRTAGNDTLDSGDWLADAGDSQRPLLRVRQAICGNLPQSAKKPAAWLGIAAAMRDMPLIICANLRNLRIKNVRYQWVTGYAASVFPPA